MACLSHPTEKYLFKVKSRKTILIFAGYGQQQKQKNDGMLYLFLNLNIWILSNFFIVNFERVFFS